MTDIHRIIALAIQVDRVPLQVRLLLDQRDRTFYNLPVNLYANIHAADFFQSFLKCRNSRKRDVLQFFEDRYDFIEHRNLDADFITSITAILEEHLNSKDVPPSPSRKYCEHLLRKIKNQH